VLDVSTLDDAADVNPVIKFLPHTVNHVARTCPLCHVIYRIVEAVAAIDRQMLQPATRGYLQIKNKMVLDIGITK
jgi:hypothetical protein